MPGRWRPHSDDGMKFQKFTPQFATILDLAVQLCAATQGDAILLVMDGPTEWSQVQQHIGNEKVLVVADLAEELAGAKEVGLTTIALDMEDSPVIEKLTQSLLESVGQELLEPGAGDRRVQRV